MSIQEFFRDWKEATCELSDSEKGRLMSALVAVFNGEEVVVSGNEKFVFPLYSARLREEKSDKERIV